MMNEHKHASVLRAIADGVPLSEFECHLMAWKEPMPLGDWLHLLFAGRDDLSIRRKPQYITVNGFKVPKPLDVMPERGVDYYAPNFDNQGWYESYTWNCDSVDRRLFDRKAIHLESKDAAAHAKAMLGIDPEAE